MLPEPETGALRELLAGWPERVSSALIRVEVLRAVRRVNAAEAYQRAENLVSRVGLVAVDHAVLGLAARLAPPGLRSLDAIHLATALSIGDDLDGIVSYDARLSEAARRSGLPTLAPGAGV